jgi:esterase/lipase
VGVLPGAEPFAADGGEVGVVLSNGFAGSPQSLRPWAEHLAAAGLTVRLPRLPGHGTSWQELNDTRWPDWYGEVERAFDDLRGGCRQVFSKLWPLVVAGLGRLTAPVLLYRSREDHVVEPLSGRLLREGAHSCEVTEVILEDSYHVATLDHDAPTIFAGSVDFVRAHTSAPAAG